MSTTDIAPLELNNVIVKMRKLINQAKTRCCQKLNQQINRLKNNSNVGEKKNRKIERISDEIKSLKKLSNDEISKFSLLNTKSFAELTEKPQSVSQLALFKVSTSEILTKFIDEFRESHPTWPIEVPFILQRLGLQYKSRKSSKKAESPSKNVQNGKKIKIVREERKNGEKDAEKDISENILDQIESKNDENMVEKPSVKSKQLKKKTKKAENFQKTTTQLEEINLESKSDENMVEKPSVKSKQLKKKTKKAENSQKTTTQLEEINLESKNDENFIKKPSKNAQTLKKKVKKSKKIAENLPKNEKISEKLPDNEKISTETKQNGRFGQMELRRLNLNEISTDEFLPSSSSIVDSNEFDDEPKPRISKPIAGEFDPFFVQDDGVIKSGSFRMAPNRKDGSIDDDSGNNSDGGGDRKKSLRSQFSQSLSGKNDSKAKFRSKNDRNSIPRTFRNGKFPAKKGRNVNPNLVPLGNSRMPMEKTQETHGKFENRRMRRQKLRKEVERKIETETLHPSWQAKRKAKEILLVPSEGKKIKFSEDD